MGTEDARRAVEAHIPDREVRRVEPLGEGYDHVVYEVDGELVVRFAKEVRDVERDGALLTAVARIAPVPTPVPVFVDGEHGCLAYRKLLGVPLMDAAGPLMGAAGPPTGAAGPALDGRALAAVVEEVAGCLAALHAAPVEGFAGLADVDHDAPDEWLAEAAEQFAEVAAAVDPRLVPAIRAFLAAPPPAGIGADGLVFSHNDLGAEHVLLGPAEGAGTTVSGIIDWSDAAIVDPAYDYGLLYRDLGAVALRWCPSALRERAVFYARCTVFEDLAYGLETGIEGYRRQSLAAMARLFG
jgi:aminoglycoside phosphotransferase (APT) family kinase protein